MYAFSAQTDAQQEHAHSPDRPASTGVAVRAKARRGLAPAQLPHSARLVCQTPGHKISGLPKEWWSSALAGRAHAAYLGRFRSLLYELLARRLE